MRWTDELIAKSILDVVGTLNLSYMPTRNEIRAFYGNDALTNKISKTYGYYGWADRLNLPIKKNDTLKGKLSEKIAAQILEQKGFSALQMPQNHPFDLLVNNLVKIDVKFSNLYHGEAGNFYSFALRKKHPSCDVYFLIARSDAGSQNVFVIPSKSVAQTQISIGERHSIYNQYLNRFDVIEQYFNQLNSIA